VADGSGLEHALNARIREIRRRLVPVRLLSALGPALLALGAYAGWVLTGLWRNWPAEAQAAQGLFAYAILILLLVRARRSYRAPSTAEAQDLLDRSIEGRPFSLAEARPAAPTEEGWELWRAHRERMARLALRSGRPDLGAAWKAADPWRLRFIVPALVLVLAILAGAAGPGRLAQGFRPDIGALFGAHRLAVEAWITPPAYTGSPPFVLTPRETAKAPEGSEVTLRILSPGDPSVVLRPETGEGRTMRPEKGPDGAYEARFTVEAPLSASVRFWGERAAFKFTIIADEPPSAEFVSPPKLGEGDRTEFEWKIGDDYGVTRLELVARLAEPPEGAEGLEEAVLMETLQLDPTEEQGAYSQDLVRHRWAGLDVYLRVRATDAAGQTGESPEAAYKLPEKIFLQPLARSSQEIRASLLREHRPYAPPDPADRFSAIGEEGSDVFAEAAASRLRLAPEGVRQAVLMIDALTYQAERFFEDPILFMGLRNARATMDAAQNKTEAEVAENILWEVALRAEYGSVSDARAALEAARRALEEALRSGASEEEIRRLMDMFEQAVENYLAAQMAEALRQGRVSQAPDGGDPNSGGRQAMGDDELQRMLDALRDLSETGARDQARQLLSDMSRMLERMENMQLQMGQQGGGGQQQRDDGPMSRALNRALQETNRTLNDQRDLSDQTEQAMRNGGDAQRLADQQRSLRERLEEQMRSGGGQPGAPQQGQQGQQGQGQGPGQQQGQGQAEQRNGQGQQGQQGQAPGDGGRQGENGPRAAPNGGGGRPGVEADGRFGQENARSRQLLGQAIDAQRRAEDALRRGDFDGARRAQQEAMSALQSRSGELARLADGADPDARRDRDERDVLGRLSEGESGFGDNVRVPDEMERQRARDILNEIRRRAGERDLTPEELDYLRRLLERF